MIFTPQSGRQYRLLVREPSAVDNLHPLPAVHDHGVVLHARDERIAVDQPARLDLTSTTIGLHRVELTRRGAAVASIVVPCSPRVTQALELPLSADVDGVLEANVSGPDGTRLAQRLLFREPRRRLTVTVVPDQARRGLDEDAGVTVSVWDPRDFDAFAATGGRVITSAFACLSLEIYSRYRAVRSKDADAKKNTLAAPAPHELDAGMRLWNAAARTDPLTGSATLRFTTPARPADLRILVDAVDARGALGSGDGLMRCGHP